jgi:hypothetical protein
MEECLVRPTLGAYQSVLSILDACGDPDRALDFFYNHQAQLAGLGQVESMYKAIIAVCMRHPSKRQVAFMLRRRLAHVRRQSLSSPEVQQHQQHQHQHQHQLGEEGQLEMRGPSA